MLADILAVAPHFTTHVSGKGGEHVTVTCDRGDIEAHIISLPAETRTCVTLLDTKGCSMTKLTETSVSIPILFKRPGPRAPRDARACGYHSDRVTSLPIVSSLILYTRLTPTVAAAQKLVYFDARKGLEASLKVPNVRPTLKVCMGELYIVVGPSARKSTCDNATHL
ncbi:hypothetical protein GH5_04470 [Leishmania sp. Ghana 2012 LV757]|uniref:hypothetical protein n=1 Tax=Leishmania sp. Ghana 2012 LV757 TaxID=2803181 RepID=UPI001B503B87|nr:hypothetical protein GH5_04470 [Leishmania sp. Ghana 2012 LV757]